MVVKRHISEEAVKAMEAEPSNFDLFYDRNYNLEEEMTKIGFTGLKRWL